MAAYRLTGLIPRATAAVCQRSLARNAGSLGARIPRCDRFVSTDTSKMTKYAQEGGIGKGEGSIELASNIPKRYLGQPTHFTHKNLMKNVEITPGISRQEYQQRRKTLMATISRALPISSKPAVTVQASGHQKVKDGSTAQPVQSKAVDSSHHVVVLLSADTKYMTDEIPYPFRQSTNFLYLSGFQEPDSALILESIPGKALPEHKATLFVQKRDAANELWDGPRAGIDGAQQFIGIEDSRPINDLSKKLDELAQKGKNLVVWYDFVKPCNGKLHQEVRQKFIEPCRTKGSNVINIEDIMHAQRVIKSPAEEKLMRSSASIAAQAIADTMTFSKPGINEASLLAKLDFSCRLKGAEILAYPPVVAGGNRANTLHYVGNNQDVLDNELVLVDAGCEYHGYASDISRTWPINGRFSAPQAELYQALLDVQKGCISKCTVGQSLDDVYRYMLEELGKRLQKIGIIKTDVQADELTKLVKKFCPHHVGHYLGMDTHDTARVSRSQQLQSGMVVTIEPGLYITETETSVPEKYRGIGIRIEDVLLISEAGPQNLSSDCPKEIKDIEALFKGKPAAKKSGLFG